MLQQTASSPGTRKLLLAGLLALGAQLLVSLPFLGTPEVLVRHFDGPNYMVVAKTLYQPTEVNPMPGYIGSPRYFAVHLPVYPLAVRGFATFTGYPAGLLLATALFGALSAAAFVHYLGAVRPGAAWLPLLLAFLLLPPRSLLYRSIGATEAPMALFVLLVAWAFHRERYHLAFLFASLATLTRINGLLVIGVLVIALAARRRFGLALGGGLAATLPLALVLAWQSHVLGTPLAFLQTHSGKKEFVPFLYLRDLIDKGDWVGGELLVGLFVLHGLAAARLWSRDLKLESGFVMAHMALFAFLRETDLSRYFVTVAPFAFVLAWDDVFANRRVVLPLLLLLGVLGCVYAWASVPQNLLDRAVYPHLLDFLTRPLDVRR